jgi:hypothetical protein
LALRPGTVVRAGGGPGGRAGGRAQGPAGQPAHVSTLTGAAGFHPDLAGRVGAGRMGTPTAPG